MGVGLARVDLVESHFPARTPRLIDIFCDMARIRVSGNHGTKQLGEWKNLSKEENRRTNESDDFRKLTPFPLRLREALQFDRCLRS